MNMTTPWPSSNEVGEDDSSNAAAIMPGQTSDETNKNFIFIM
jgi:hypothetical protein